MLLNTKTVRDARDVINLVLGDRFWSDCRHIFIEENFQTPFIGKYLLNELFEKVSGPEVHLF